MTETMTTTRWTARLHLLVLLIAAACLTVACGDDGDDDADASGGDSAAADGEGTFSLTVYGEAFIENGIPAEEFVDGWATTFDHFLIVVQDVAIEQHGADPIPAGGGAKVLDVAASSGGSGHSFASLTLPAGTYDHLIYRIAPSGSATAANVGDAEMALVEGHAVYVSGSATKGDVTKTFEWVFDADKTYTACHLAAGKLADEGEASAQMTIHGDHLFYDDLESEEPNVAFDLIASADADDDGVITMEELSAVDITGESRYQVGSRTDITTLYEFMDAQIATLGHIDGEGHCD